MQRAGSCAPQFCEAHFCSLQSQSNIYGISAISSALGKNRLLVSCLSGEIVLIEHRHSAADPEARRGLLSKPVQLSFTSTPVEVVAIDAYNSPAAYADGGEEIVLAIATSRPARALSAAGVTGAGVGIAAAPAAVAATVATATQSAAQGREYSLNIYRAVDGSLTNFVAVEGGVHDLPYAPCHLTHVKPSVTTRLTAVDSGASVRLHNGALTQATAHPVFLLGGSDYRVHQFGKGYNPVAAAGSAGPSSDEPFRCFTASETAESFPEFDRPFGDEPLWIDVKYTADVCHRVTAVGYRRGVTLCIVSTPQNGPCVVTTRFGSECMVGPVTSTRLFTETADHPRRPDFLKWGSVQPTASGTTGTALLFGGSSSSSTGGLGSEPRDLSLCPAPVLGSHAAVHLLVTSAFSPAVVYRDVLACRLTQPVHLPGSEKHDCVLGSCVADVDFDGRNELLLVTYGRKILAYKFEGRRQTGAATWLFDHELPYPGLAVRSIDIHGDGMHELIALSSRGVHILQHDVDAAASLCRLRLQRIVATLR